MEGTFSYSKNNKNYHYLPQSQESLLLLQYIHIVKILYLTQQIINVLSILILVL